MKRIVILTLTVCLFLAGCSMGAPPQDSASVKAVFESYTANEPGVSEGSLAPVAVSFAPPEDSLQATSIVIECDTEKIIVKQGTELKIELDVPESRDNYILRDNVNIPHEKRYWRFNKWDIYFSRKDRQDTSAAYSAVITLTVPHIADGLELLLITKSGDIYGEGLDQVRLTANSEKGNIHLAEMDTQYISTSSEAGDIDLINVMSASDIEVRSQGGTVNIQLSDCDNWYAVKINTAKKANITINGQSYDGGSYILGNGEGQTIALKGVSNTFTLTNVQLRGE